MKYSQTIGFIAVVLAILVCFMPLVYIESKNLTITGFKADGTRFGRPGMFIVYMGSIAAGLFLIPKSYFFSADMSFILAHILFSVRAGVGRSTSSCCWALVPLPPFICCSCS